MARKRRGGLESFMDGFNSTYGTVRKVARDAESAQVMAEQPETSTALSERNVPEGMTYDSDTGQYVTSGASDSVEVAAPRRPEFDSKTSTSYLGKTYDTPVSDTQRFGLQSAKLADIAAKYGDPTEAIRLRTGAAHAEKLGRENEAERSIAAAFDEASANRPDSVTRAFGGDTKPDRSNAGLNMVPFKGALPAGAESAQPTAATPDAQGAPKLGGNVQPISAVQKPGDDAAYYERFAPKIIQSYLRAGEPAKAKAYQDFVDSQAGRVYVKTWDKVVRLTAMGAFDEAMPAIANLYNSQIPDGKHVEVQRGEGDQFKIRQINTRTGELVGERTGSAGELSKLGIFALAPEKRVELDIRLQNDLAKKKADEERALLLENSRSKREDAREDRRDTRLEKQLTAQSENLDRRLSSGGLTLVQRAHNYEIDAARKAVADLSPKEITRRTAKATNTGRTNEDYDPGLARQAGLANRRKIGEDSFFDNRQGQSDPSNTFAGRPIGDYSEDQLRKMQSSASTDASTRINTELMRRSHGAIGQRFSTDQRMSGYRLGPIDKKKGLPVVLDKSGQTVGYYD